MRPKLSCIMTNLLGLHDHLNHYFTKDHEGNATSTYDPAWFEQALRWEWDAAGGDIVVSGARNGEDGFKDVVMRWGEEYVGPHSMLIETALTRKFRCDIFEMHGKVSSAPSKITMQAESDDMTPSHTCAGRQNHPRKRTRRHWQD